MLSPEQKAHFDTFGFLILRQAFTSDEIDKITSEAENLWAEDRKKTSSKDRQINPDGFLERNPSLMELLDDDRIQETIEGLLGPAFVWAGSEGQITHHREHGWHPDRPGDEVEQAPHGVDRGGPVGRQDLRHAEEGPEVHRGGVEEHQAAGLLGHRRSLAGVVTVPRPRRALG